MKVIIKKLLTNSKSITSTGLFYRKAFKAFRKSKGDVKFTSELFKEVMTEMLKSGEFTPKDYSMFRDVLNTCRDLNKRNIYRIIGTHLNKLLPYQLSIESVNYGMRYEMIYKYGSTRLIYNMEGFDVNLKEYAVRSDSRGYLNIFSMVKQIESIGSWENIKEVLSETYEEVSYYNSRIEFQDFLGEILNIKLKRDFFENIAGELLYKKMREGSEHLKGDRFRFYFPSEPLKFSHLTMQGVFTDGNWQLASYWNGGMNVRNIEEFLKGISKEDLVCSEKFIINAEMYSGENEKS